MLIYVATNTRNKKVYVGMTSTTLRARIASHLHSAKRGAKTPFHKALQKYGIEAFRFEVVAYAESRDDLEQLEIAEIAKRNSFAPNGYNVTRGGDGQKPGYKPSMETRLKAGVASRARWASLTPEERAERGRKISEAKKGRKRGPISVVSPVRGRKRSEEFKRKVSEGMKRMCAELPPGEMARRGRCKKAAK